jgi:hypothetical protein
VAAPYIACGSLSLQGDESTWAWLFYTSLLAFVVYVIGFPVLWLSLLLAAWRKRSLYTTDVRSCIGFLYIGYRPQCWPWYLVQTVRLIVFVMTVSFMSQGSFARQVCVELVLIVFLVLHLLVQPYASRMENAAEAFSLSMLCIMQACAAYTEVVLLAEAEFGEGDSEKYPLNVQAAYNMSLSMWRERERASNHLTLYHVRV